MSIDELTHADHAMQLGTLGDALDDRGIPTQLIDPNAELPVTTLIVPFGPDDRNRDRTLAVSIMPLADDLDSTQLVQFFVQIPFEVDESNIASVQRATAIVNSALALGNFGTQANQLFFRHVMAVPRSQSFDIEMTVEVVGLIGFHQEHFGDYFEGIIDGEITVAHLPQLLAEG